MIERSSIWAILRLRPRFRLRTWPYDLSIRGERFYVMIVEYYNHRNPEGTTYRTQVSRGPHEPFLFPIESYATRDEPIVGAHRQVEAYLDMGQIEEA